MDKGLRIKYRILLFFISVSVLCGCGRTEYSGVEVKNKAAITESLRRVMINRSYAMDIVFDAETADEEVLRKLSEELISEVFYESDDPKGGDYLRYQYGGCSMEPCMDKDGAGYSYRLRMIPEYYTTAEEELYVDSEISRILKSIKDDPGLSEYEKVKAVRDHICDTVSYDTVHKHMKGSGHVQSTAYGCLYYHTALCQGYAVLTYRMLKELGMDVRIIKGDLFVNGRMERHAWNIVRIGDEYYNLDVTMDDINRNYDHFLKSDESFNRDHKRDEEFLTEDFYREYPVSSMDHEYE